MGKVSDLPLITADQLSDNDILYIVDAGNPNVSKGILYSEFKKAVSVPIVLSHTRYFGWSDDRSVIAADFLSANSSQTDEGVLPARSGNGYIWFAVPTEAGYPTQLYLPGGTRNVITSFPRLPGTINDHLGDPHIVGVSNRVQIASFSGGTVRLGYG